MLICCYAACNRQGNLFLRFKLCGISRLRKKMKYRRHVRVAGKLLNRLYILAPAVSAGTMPRKTIWLDRKGVKVYPSNNPKWSCQFRFKLRAIIYEDHITTVNYYPSRQRLGDVKLLV
jgi:hypothetical protein